MTKCCLCENTDSIIIYDGPIREGTFGNETKEAYKVIECKGCGLKRLSVNPLSIEYYQSEEYRQDYNETPEVDDYLQVHDSEQIPRLERIGVEHFRNKVVVDYGCGGGAFLDLISGVAKKTIGIEPFQGFHKSLSERGHEVFSDVQSALKRYEGKVETIISFGVIEHIEDPLDYLLCSNKLLNEKGNMFLDTDNFDDILLKINPPGFEKFFYRTAHLWYFEGRTLSELSKKAGFNFIETHYRHNFDLSNLILWARDRKPTGLKKLDLFDEQANSAWKAFLEFSGQSDLVCLRLKK